ncbi:hypothetical protein MWH03_00455 [Klebsiella pneumoniae]|nr:hypothetical protein [Klebsiella pneumoniae]
MNKPTNIIAQVETPFLETVRKHMATRDGAFQLGEWAFQQIDAGTHPNEVKQLVGELINEAFAVKQQLARRGEQ